MPIFWINIGMQARSVYWRQYWIFCYQPSEVEKTVLRTYDFLDSFYMGSTLRQPCSKDRCVSCNHGVQRSRPSGGQDQMPYRFIGCWLSRTARAQNHAAYNEHIKQAPTSLSSNQAQLKCMSGCVRYQRVVSKFEDSKSWRWSWRSKEFEMNDLKKFFCEELIIWTSSTARFIAILFHKYKESGLHWAQSFKVRSKVCESWHCGMALLKKSRWGAVRSLSRLKAPPFARDCFCSLPSRADIDITIDYFMIETLHKNKLSWRPIFIHFYKFRAADSGYLATVVLLVSSLAEDFGGLRRLADAFGLLDESKPRRWQLQRHRKAAICRISTIHVGMSWRDLWGTIVDEEFGEKHCLAELDGFDPLHCSPDSCIFRLPIFGALCATAAERSLAIPICGVPEDSRVRDSGRQDVVESHLFVLALCSAGHCLCSWPFLPSPGPEADFVPDHLRTTLRNPWESLRCLLA